MNDIGHGRETPAKRRMPRRRFLSASVIGAGVAALDLTAAQTGRATAPPGAGRRTDLADAVLAAFRRHRLVAVGEAHGLAEHHDALLALLADERVAAAVDDIVVEFGNARHQAVADRLIVSGAAVTAAEVRPIWRDTTQSPLGTWDQPVYERFYRAVRAANQTRPVDRRIRVLLGDPAIDWSAVATKDQWFSFQAQRDSAMADAIGRSLSRGRVLFLAGLAHVTHAAAPPATQPPAPSATQPATQPATTPMPPPNAVTLVEQATGERAHVVCVAVPAAGDPDRQLSAYPVQSVIPVSGSWLATATFGQIFFGAGAPGVFGGASDPAKQPLAPAVDAVLYVGGRTTLTASQWDPAIYLDADYWAELQRRSAVIGLPPTVLQNLRSETPVLYVDPVADALRSEF